MIKKGLIRDKNGRFLSGSDRKLNLNEPKLIELYLKGNSSYKIASILNCSRQTIVRRLKNNGIKIRNGKGERVGWKLSKKTRKKMRISKIGDKNSFYNKYHPEKTIKKMRESALKPERILISIKNLPKYKKGENPTIGRKRPKISMENHPNWQGGLSFEPYDKSFNNKFKRAIRKRDNYVCMKCGKHQEKEGKSLCIHHINYDKLISIPQNCCALCNKCNSEVNFNRKHWTKFFQSLLFERYDYKYSENEEIILNLNIEKENKWQKTKI